MSKKVLVTGAAGFAGHHFIEHALETTDWDIVGLYSLRHRGDAQRLPVSERFKPFFHDLSGPLSDRERLMIGYCDYIVNMAADSHVERSIQDPVPFVRNNVEISLNMLEFARAMSPVSFVQISTDEVYGPALEWDKHKEWREILPSNPYAASKACQEALAISYWRTYGVPLIITNTMNMCGPRQDSEKFIPMCIRKIHRGEMITIHGSTNAIGSRQYLHAKNHADAIIFLLNSGAPTAYNPDVESLVQVPERYNVVGENEINNLDMATIIATMMKKELKYDLVDFHQARPGHDRRYALDGSKIAELGWRAPISLEQTIKETIEFTLANPEWMD